MKIAWFHSHLLHANSGGTRFVLDYSAALRDSFGHEVTMFCDLAGPEAIAQLERNGMALRQLDTVSTNSPVYWLTLSSRLRRKRLELVNEMAEYDFIINSMFPMNVLTSCFDKPCLQMCYEPFAFFYDPGFLRNFTLSQQLFFRLAKLIYSKADIVATRRMNAVLTVNKTNIPKIEEVYGITPQVVYAGIDTKVYKRASEAEIAAVRSRHCGSPLLFHSTDLTGIKGTYPLLSVVKRLREDFPNLKLLVTVYVNNPQGIKMLQDTIASEGLSGNVEYLGCLEKSELPLYYSAVDFVCQPSVNQPANWPLKEALLCHTPIIGGKQSEETIDFVNGISVDINDCSGTVEKMSQLFNKRHELVIDTSELVKNYSKDGCISHLNTIIEQAYANYRH